MFILVEKGCYLYYDIFFGDNNYFVIKELYLYLYGFISDEQIVLEIH